MKKTKPTKPKRATATPGISIPAETHKAAKARAAELGWTFSGYVQKLVELEVDKRFFVPQTVNFHG